MLNECMLLFEHALLLGFFLGDLSTEKLLEVAGKIDVFGHFCDSRGHKLGYLALATCLNEFRNTVTHGLNR